MRSTSSVLLFVLTLTSIVALILAFLQNGLKSKHDFNEAMYSKKATIAAVANHLDVEDFSKISEAEVTEIFDKQIKQMVLKSDGTVATPEELQDAGVRGGLAENLDLKKENKKSVEERYLPLYEFTKSDGNKYYIVYARGKGLWDEIWGNIALESDVNTIAGVSFDHKAETPGLGAEIKDNKAWVRQFIGKKLYDNDGTFRAIDVKKGGAKDPYHEVDAISGATITGDGITDMLLEDLVAYEPYLKTIKG